MILTKRSFSLNIICAKFKLKAQSFTTIPYGIFFLIYLAALFSVAVCRIFSHSMRELVPWWGIKLGSCAFGGQSLSHGATREIPTPYLSKLEQWRSHLGLCSSWYSSSSLAWESFDSLLTNTDSQAPPPDFLVWNFGESRNLTPNKHPTEFRCILKWFFTVTDIFFHSY